MLRFGVYNISMKKAIVLVLGILFLVGCEYPIKNLDSKGNAIICFGDSITFGEGALPEESYPQVLSKLIKRQVVNAGVSGDTSAMGLRRLNDDALSLKPFLVIVELGGNDFMRQAPRKETLDNLKQIILNIQSAGAAVALCDISDGFIMSGYRQDYKELAEKTGSIFIPELMSGILTDPNFKSDQIHPNKDGYALIAQRVYRVLSKNFEF
jgi:acyl-CoA thioesterase-1